MFSTSMKYFRFNVSIASLTLFALLVAGSPSARADLLKCQQAFPHWSAGILDKPVWSLTPAERINHDPNQYLYKRTFETEVKDQSECRGGTCWVYGTSEVYEFRARKAGYPVTLSKPFFLYHQLLEKAFTAIDSPVGTEVDPIRGGGSALAYKAIFEDFGALPEDKWVTGQLDLNDALQTDRFLIDLNLLVHHLRKNPPADPKESKRLIKDYLTRNLGHAPRTFRFGTHSRLTPLKFSRLAIFRAPRRVRKISLRIKTDPLRAWYAVAEQLARTHEPVPLSVEWVHSFIDKKTGIISIKAFDTLGLDTGTLIEATKTRQGGVGGHLVSIIDIDFDESGRPRKLLLLNSHGADVGDEGYFHMYWDYFSKLGTSVYVDAPPKSSNGS